MDKINVVSGFLFFVAEIFAIASVANQDWINSGIEGGSITIGLTYQCQTIYGRKRTCFHLDPTPEWMSTMFFLVAAIFFLSITCFLLIVAHWKHHLVNYAKWMAFCAISCVSYVGLIFPIGFRQNVIGGQAYKLPNMWHLGDSYKLLWVFCIIFGCCGCTTLLLPIRSWIFNRRH